MGRSGIASKWGWDYRDHLGAHQIGLPTITPSFCGSNHQEYLCGFPLSQLGKNTPLSESVEIDRGIDG